MTNREIASMYAEKEWRDIKDWCIKNKQTIKYRGKTYYLYQGHIYDGRMDVIIEVANKRLFGFI